MGLVILGALALYLVISIFVVIGAIKHAKKTGKSTKRWGWGAALVMYLIPFWDWIPTVAVHQYYCATEAGFWVYKSLDQWKSENPQVLLTQNGRSTSSQQEDGGYKEIHQLNSRFRWVIKLHQVSSVLQIVNREEILVDARNNENLARFVDFSRGNQRSTGTTKFWLVSRDCSGTEIYRVRMGKLIDEIYAGGKGGIK